MARGIVRINTYDQRSTPQGVDTPYKRAVDLGPGIAPALNQATDALNEYNENLARANAAELDNELADRIRERLYNTNTGYLTTARGGNASARRAEIEEALRADAAEIAGRARNGMAQRLYEEVAARRAAQALDSIARHDQDETRRYIEEQSEARITRAIDLLVLGANDESHVANQMATIEAEVADAARRNGWGEQITAARLQDIRSQALESAVRTLAETNPEDAEALYNLNAPSMSAEARANLAATLRGARQRQGEQLVDQAYGHIARGERIPRDLWNRITRERGQDAVRIQDYLRNRQSNGAASMVRDQSRLRALELLAIDRPNEFAQRDLTQDLEAIGHDEYLRLRGVQNDLRSGSGARTIEQSRTTFNALRQTASTQIAPFIGALPSDSAEDRGAGMRARRAFDALLLEEYRAFEQTNPNVALTPETSQLLIARAMVRMRDEDVADMPRPDGARFGMRVEGDRGLTRGRVRLPESAGIEVVVPYDMIPQGTVNTIARALQDRGVSNPTRGEIQNAYAALVAGGVQSAEQADQVFDSVVVTRR